MISLELSSPASAGLVNVLVLDYDTSAGFGNGERYQAALNDIANPANFGTGGTVNRSMNILPTVNSLTGVDLSDVGLIITAHNHQESLLWDDAVAIANHVSNNGASVLALGHSYSDISGTVIGDYTNTPSLGNWMTNRFMNKQIGSNAYRLRKNSTSTGVASGAETILDGAFGDLRGSLMSSAHNQFWTGSTTGSSGTFALQFQFFSTFNGSDGLFGNYGSGRYMLLGSADMLGAADVGIFGTTGPRVPSQYGSTNNQAFFKNTVDFLTESTIILPVPEPTSFALFSIAGASLLNRRRRV